jgi:hypothetical protein
MASPGSIEPGRLFPKIPAPNGYSLKRPGASPLNGYIPWDMLPGTPFLLPGPGQKGATLAKATDQQWGMHGPEHGPGCWENRAPAPGGTPGDTAGTAVLPFAPPSPPPLKAPPRARPVRSRSPRGRSAPAEDFPPGRHCSRFCWSVPGCGQGSPHQWWRL